MFEEWMIDSLFFIGILIVYDLGMKYLVEKKQQKRIFKEFRDFIVISIGAMSITLVWYILKLSVSSGMQIMLQIIATLLICLIVYLLDYKGVINRKP